MNDSLSAEHCPVGRTESPRRLGRLVVYFSLAVGAFHGALVFALVWVAWPQSDVTPPSITLAPFENPAPAVTIRDHDGIINDIAFLPDGRLVTAGRDGVLHIWELEPVRLVATSKEQGGAIRSIVVSADPPTLYAASDGLLKIWSFDPLRPVAEHKSPSEEFRTVRVAASANFLATLDRKGNRRLWDLRDGRLSPRSALAPGSAWGLFPLGLTPEGRLVDHADRDAGLIHVRRLDGGPARAIPFKKSDMLFQDFTFIGPLHQLAVGGDDGIRLWDADSGKELAQLPDSRPHCWCLGSSPDGKLLAGGFFNVVEAWNVQTGSKAFSIRTGRTGVIRLVFSHDRRWIAALHSDIGWPGDQPGYSEVSVWKVDDQK